MSETSDKSGTKQQKLKNKSIKKRMENWMSDKLMDVSERYKDTCAHRFFFSICNNTYFSVFILLCIAVNTVTLSLDRYPIDYDVFMKLEIINNVCTYIFVGEMVIKLLGLGIKGYLMDSMNQFDGLIVIVSLVEIIIASQTDSQDNISLTIFRGFRLLRVFRLARNWDSFHKMMVKIGQTLKDILNFLVVLLIVVSVFSLLGAELFNNYVRFDNQNMVVSLDDPTGLPPVQNFDSFENSFVSIFVCLIGEDWQVVMHNYARAY